MKNQNRNIIQEKKAAAARVLDYIQSGMTIGLGTGSTVKFLIELLANKIENGLEVKAVSTSEQTSKLAISHGIEIINFNDIDKIDLTIDGADEVDFSLNGIKGGGGALLYEKIVASNSELNIWIIDSTKFVKNLGLFPVPIEVVRFGSQHLFKKLKLKGLNPQFRKDGEHHFVTDSDHEIIDLHLNGIDQITSLNSELLSMEGVVETGLFIDICDVLIVGDKDECKVINKERPAS